MAIKEGHSKLLVWRKEDGRRHIQFEDKSFADIAYHNEIFYALSVDGLILSVDSKTLDVTELAKYPYISYFGSYVCLVKSFKKIFLTYELECLYTGDEGYVLRTYHSTSSSFKKTNAYEQLVLSLKIKNKATKTPRK